MAQILSATLTKSPRIWALDIPARFRRYENKRLRSEAKKLGLNFRVLAAKDINILAGCPRQTGEFCRRRNGVLPNFVFLRSGAVSTDYAALAALRMFEQFEIPLLNPIVSVRNAQDKLRTIQILATNNLPVPKTWLVRFPIDLKFVKREFKFPVVFKIISGGAGKGVFLCQTPADLEDIAGVVERLVLVGANFILQEFIASSFGKDIRVIVLGDQVIGAMQRTAKLGSFKANFSAGGSVEQIPVTPAIKKLALSATKALGLRLAGVDLLFDENGYRICEVNCSPGFEGFEKATGLNVPKAIFEFIQKELAI